MVYIGVDLHRKKSQVAALDQEGKLLFNRKIRTGPCTGAPLVTLSREQEAGTTLPSPRTVNEPSG